MFSGRRPRGRSSTPLSGKMGGVGGSWAIFADISASEEPALMRSVPLGKQDGGKAFSCGDRQRVHRPHRLEELDELLARRLLVPLAIELDEGQQRVDRALAVAAGEQGGRKGQPGIVIIRVEGQAGFELTRGTGCLGAGFG